MKQSLASSVKPDRKRKGKLRMQDRRRGPAGIRIAIRHYLMEGLN
jgi:hypothetical protein